jgi:hypothetical protein
MRKRGYRDFSPDSFWDSALAAADLELSLVRPSRSVSDALLAAADEVSLPGAWRCDMALPAAESELSPVASSRNVFDEFDAALEPVSLLSAIRPP